MKMIRRKAFVLLLSLTTNATARINSHPSSSHTKTTVAPPRHPQSQLGDMYEPHEIIIPEQRFVFDASSEDDEVEQLKHLLELADLIAYESANDEDGEHVPPTYIGRHNF